MMKFPKKIIILIIVAIFWLNFIPIELTQAASLTTITTTSCPSTPCTSGICIPNPLCAQNFAELLGMIIDFLFTLALAIVPLMIIIAAFYFITAGASDKPVEQTTTAKKIILYTLVGFVIILLAKGLIKLLEEIFGVQLSP